MTDQASSKDVCLDVYTSSEQVYIFISPSGCLTNIIKDMTLEQVLEYTGKNDIKRYILTKSTAAHNECLVLSESSNIPDYDVCLAKISNGNHRCLATYEQRAVAAHAKDSAGNNRFWGYFPCDGQVYAFVNEKLPPPPVDAVAELGVCHSVDGTNPCVVGGVVGGVLVLLFAVGIFALYRLSRYRTKYKAEKEHLDELADRAADLDEFAGGLGIADDDVDMIANPLVIEMQNLQEQIAKVQDDMGVQVERDVGKTDELEMERQRLHAEIERVKKAMAGMQANKAPARAAEIPAMHAAQRPGGGAAAVVSNAQVTVRHDFGQVNRAKKKKL